MKSITRKASISRLQWCLVAKNRFLKTYVRERKHCTPIENVLPYLLGLQVSLALSPPQSWMLSQAYGVRCLSDTVLVSLTPQEDLPMPSQFAMPWIFQQSFGQNPESFSNIRGWWPRCIKFSISETQPKIQEGFFGFWTLILGFSILSFESMEGLLSNLLICHPICLEALAYCPAEGEAQRFGRWEADESWQGYCIQLRFLSEKAGKRWKQERSDAKDENQPTSKGQNRTRLYLL